jgi:hypothetical protein
MRMRRRVRPGRLRNNRCYAIVAGGVVAAVLRGDTVALRLETVRL